MCASGVRLLPSRSQSTLLCMYALRERTSKAPSSTCARAAFREVFFPMDFVAVPAGTAPALALTMRGADPDLTLASGLASVEVLQEP